MIKARNGGAPPAPRVAASLSALVGQELYRAALFAVFFLQIVVLGYVPYIGTPCREAPYTSVITRALGLAPLSPPCVCNRQGS